MKRGYAELGHLSDQFRTLGLELGLHPQAARRSLWNRSGGARKKPRQSRASFCLGEENILNGMMHIRVACM
jgi:hypothetical protein